MSYPPISKSITNPDVSYSNALDVNTPMSYLVFLKNIGIFDGDVKKYYNNYINTWNNTKKDSSNDSKNEIVERYREFIKDIALNYTTLEEKKFLSNIDFNDPHDLEIAIPFFTNKIRQISEYYRIKREETKFELQNQKLKGTPTGLEKNIKKWVVSYLENLQDGGIIVDIENLKQNIEVEIEELYDVSGDYYNQTPEYGTLDKTDLDYGLDIFLKTNSELISSVFTDFSSEMLVLKEIDDLLDNKRNLTKKNIYSDFYFLSTNTTNNVLSGKAFESTNPIFNFLNRDYPTHIFTEKLELENPKERGFFTPDKRGIILVDGVTSGYQINYNNLNPNEIVYYPDPLLFSGQNDAVTFITDDSSLKRNYTSGIAKDQPYSKDIDTKYYGYVSKVEPNHDKYFDKIYNSGYLKDFKSDIYGNLFGLLKQSNKFDHSLTYKSNTKIKYYQVLNGHAFYDTLYGEGYSFNYDTIDATTFTETERTGLSGGNFGTFSNNKFTVINFGNFKQKKFLEPKEENISLKLTLVDGINFTDNDGNYYPDAISSDLYDLITTDDIFYYNYLVEGGISNNNPLTRGLVDPSYPLLSSQFYFVDDNSYDRIVDGGSILNDYDYTPEEESNVYYALSSDCQTVVESQGLSSLNNNSTIYIRNHYDKSISPLLTEMSYLSSRYNSNIIDQIRDNVNAFEIVANTMMLETNNYLIIDTIEMDDLGNFIKSSTNPYYLEFLENPYQNTSNRLKINDKIYFSKIIYDNIDSNIITFHLEIYDFDLSQKKTTKLHPLGTPTYFSLSGGNTRYVSCDKMSMVFDSRKGIFSTSFLFKDQNNYPILNTIDFKISSAATILSHVVTPFSNTSQSIIFDNYTFSTLLSSTTPTITNEILIL